MIGGIFTVFNKEISSTYTFEKEPPAVKCAGFDLRACRWTQVMIFAIEEINKEPALLPNITLGYRILNSCASPTNTLRAALTLASGAEEMDSTSACPPAVSALIAEPGSSQSLAVAGTLGPFQVPIVSYFSTCACLSDRAKYPGFFRTIPSDYFQAKALAALVKRFGWQWIGIIQSDNDYGRNGILAFTEEVRKLGVCVAFDWTILYTNVKFIAIVEALRKSTSKVVLLFMPLAPTKSFLSEIKKYNITGKQWVGSEAWITQTDLASDGRKSLLQGAMGFALPQASIPGLGEFLLSFKPSDEPQSAIVKDIWESFFDCSFSPSNTSATCTGTEDLSTVSSDYTDVTHFRAENNVYKAVYLVAYAIHALLQCHNGSNPTTGKSCVTKDQVQPKLVLEQIKYVNFTTQSGAKVFFDENGDSVAQYDLVNWQIKDNGSVEIVNIGQFDTSLPEGEKFKLKDNTKIVWGGNSMQLPRSVCREPCPPGTRKALTKHKPVCCFDCFECPEGTISNETNSPDCLICPPELWPNENKDQCLPKPTEYLSYKEIMGALLTGFGCVGIFLSLLTSIIFLTHKETPIVKANNSELSFLLLFSLTLCFLCSLTFIGRPSEWSCMLRHTAFGITFVLCISCVLGKTIVVLMAFRATLPGRNMMKWFGPAQQRLSVLSFTLVQVVICVLWLTTNPPFPRMNMKYYKDKIILECALGSAVGFWAVLGYIGLLALLCFILAFFARKLPDSFNEAKLITFSMLIFCAVWITFIPAYVSSPGKFTVAVEIFAILASSFGLLICIFVPKCYIILFRPEQNSKRHLMGKIPPMTL
ncbi:extracellular calcium-sensing receptor-like [Limanda limanda]|uniref:extracellular calcium-sensing receptor-like n=1 Tax=Limanda limanda TaxID=27771 RepID=UPI0029C86390|nr:extracellular calcium-sensing receptor-like [Limanda limanda]